MHRWGGSAAFPSVITVFSAPNYCGTYSNKGAVILIENDKMNIKQYKDVDHPFHLPGDIDLFTWSMPFLAEKITEMLYSIVGSNAAFSPKSAKELENIDFHQIMKDSQKEATESERMDVLRAKVRSVARMQRLFKNLRYFLISIFNICFNIGRTVKCWCKSKSCLQMAEFHVACLLVGSLLLKIHIKSLTCRGPLTVSMKNFLMLIPHIIRPYQPIKNSSESTLPLASLNLNVCLKINIIFSNSTKG
jgi:hypothetical protein